MEQNSTATYSCFESELSEESSTTSFWAIPPELQPAALSTAVLTLLFIAVGLPGNLLIMAGIISQRLYREPTYLLLLNLTVADLLVCVLVMPLTAVSGLAGGFMLGRSDSTRCGWCNTGILFVALCLVSLHTLALMALDRLIFVKFPMKYQHTVTVGRVLCCVLLNWVLCSVLSLCPIFGFGDVYFSFSISTCTIKAEGRTRVAKNIHYFILLVAIAVLPLLLLIITNTWLVCIIQKHIRSIYHTVQRSSAPITFTESIRKRLGREKNHKQLQLMRVFGAILLSHVFSWLPLIVRILVNVVRGNDEHHLWVYVFTFLCLSFAAVSHPIVQASFLPEVRSKCKSFLMRILCCGSLWRKVGLSGGARDKPGNRSATGSVLHLAEQGKKTCPSCFCFEVLSATVLPNEDLNSPV